MITRLATSPTNANLLYATVANFGHGHVFRSDDGGTTWEDLDKGQLPDVPHHAIATGLIEAGERPGFDEASGPLSDDEGSPMTMPP